MARRRRARRRPLLVGIDDEGIGAFPGRRQVELRAEQPLIEEPDATGIGAGRCRPDDPLDRSGSCGSKERFQDEKVEPFIFQSEAQMPFESLRGSVPGRIDIPSVLLVKLVTLADGGECTRRRDFSAEMRLSERHTQRASPAPGAADPEKL